jgi:hypothetical protein
MPLHFPDGKRIDEVWTDTHKRALADYHDALPTMNRRYLQEDGKAVVWHDRKGRRATIFSFADREVALPGKVQALSTGEKLPKSARYRLQAQQTYVVTDCELPRTVE